MRYLRLFPAVLLAALLVSCNTTKKLYETQQYDQVIQRVAPDICAGHVNNNNLHLVTLSYHKANQADHERIQALKGSGQPDVWPEVYQRYCSMKGRNEALACFPTKIKKSMNYVKLDLDDDMAVSRSKAESYLVAKANQLLSTGSKTDAEEAVKYIEQLRRTNAESSHLTTLELKYEMCMTDKVEFGLLSDYDFSDSFIDALFTFGKGELPAKEIYYSTNPSFAYVVIDKVDVTPVRLDEVTFKEENGGKSVEVTDHSQNKTATVTGTIEYFPKRSIRYASYSVPFEVKSTFKNDYTTIKGDQEACSAETLSRLNTSPVPVPTDESMLIDAARRLNDMIAAELRK